MSARICSAHKANVLEVSAFRREVATNVHAAEYGDVELSHVYVDNAAMIAGPIGMLPSAMHPGWSMRTGGARLSTDLLMA